MSRKEESDEVLLPPGAVVDDKYEIISKIGQGGMGIVYKARDPVKRDVALKMLTHVDHETLQRFRREALALSAVKHRAVVRIDAFGESPLGPYLVLEYVAGKDLGAVARSPLPIEEAVDLTLAICGGVSACHAAQVVHRDLKPSNIRVKNATLWSERVKILDFGLALQCDSALFKANQARITSLGSVPGTPRYIAPELLRHEAATPQCDQYGIGCLLYLLLTARAPFHDLEGDELRQAILHGDYPAIRMLRSAIPPELQAAIARALALNPDERFPSVNHFALEIVSCATPSLKATCARYFSNAQQVYRRLVERLPTFPSPPPTRPSSRLQAPPVASPVQQRAPMIVTPLVETPTPQIQPAYADAGPARAPSQPPEATEAFLPEASPADAGPGFPKGVRRHGRARDYSILFVFVCGAVLGAAFTVGGFICVSAYQRRTACCACPNPPGPGLGSAAAAEKPEYGGR